MTESGPRVLLVDDREQNFVALEAVLQGCGGVAFDRACSGPDALDRLLEDEYAVAVVDVQMPEMDGFELVRLMRGAERTKRTPVIFLTAGELSKAAEARGYDLGAVDYIRKPFDPGFLRAKVRVFVELQHERLRALQAERLLRETTQRLADSEALLDGIVEAAPVGIGFVDRDLRYKRVNAALAGINGVPAADHLGRRVTELLPDVPGPELEALWRRVLTTGEPIVDVQVSGKVPGSPEQRVWTASYYPVYRGGVATGVALLVREVTHERRAAELQRLLVGIVGHDLRNPLSTVVTATALLGRPDVPDELRQRNVTRIRDAAHRMDRLISDLLDYTRARGGAGIPIDAADASIDEVLRTVADDCAAAHPQRAIHVVAQSAGGNGRWDVARLHQLFANLVTNAIKYGAADAPVELRWRESGDRLCVDVVNRGEPIPEEAQEHIFEPLSQLSDSVSARRGGIGLGLFISREIARAHQGAIRVRSAEQETVFSVELPRECPRSPGPMVDLRPAKSPAP